MELSQSKEDYLAAIYRLTQQGEKGSTTVVASRLGVSAASATAMFQKLAAEGLVEYREYAGVSLTPHGERLALDVIRRHRLAERFLTDILEIPWDRVDEMAHRMEHALPREVLEGFDRLLGAPTTCPHGYPIPTSDGRVVERPAKPLAQMQPGEEGAVVRVREDDPELLRYLRGCGLVPGARVRVEALRPFDEPITLVVDGKEQVVGHRVAESVFVGA
ncbi:MAG: metal-dependent transcriptional regulator [Limnochordaceae bacterium]|nr:metal-dependent transcriptional regulator [Limnochordaceae bacterium]